MRLELARDRTQRGLAPSGRTRHPAEPDSEDADRLALAIVLGTQTLTDEPATAED